MLHIRLEPHENEQYLVLFYIFVIIPAINRQTASKQSYYLRDLT